VSLYQVIKECRAIYPIGFMTRVLGVSRSGYYDWLDREPSPRERRQEHLAAEVRDAFEQSFRIYGSRKITHELAERNVQVCRNTVAGLMRENHLKSRAQKRRRFTATTDSNHPEPPAPNTLSRDFAASRPNKKWVADITYIPTADGFVYLAAVMDLYSRRVVGWSLSDTLETTIVLDALRNAIARRRPGAGLLHHSDRGVQYASGRYRELLESHGIDCSMSRRGNCWDNAPMERFMGSLKSEWVHHESYATIEEVGVSVFKYIDMFYNRVRRHQSLGYISPAAFEENAA